MKILQLSFKNLNSLRGSFSIDFENGPLAEAGLFAITGPTGAGKTTILDAITLGIFGKAARYDNDRGSPEHVMSRGTGECFAEVTFSCNSGVYTSRWDLARARKKADGKVQSPKRQLSKPDGEILEEKIKLVDQKIIELTGLDYARFLRSVLLAQGRFKEFLDADGKDRGELLEKITGTEIYSQLSVAAHERAKEVQTSIDDARRSLAGIKLLEIEEVENLQQERQKIEATYVAKDLKLKQLEVQVRLFDRMLELEKERSTLQERQASWAKAIEGFGKKAQQIELFDKALPLASDLTSWQRFQKAQAQGELDLQELEKAYVKSSDTLSRTLNYILGSCVGMEKEADKAIDEQNQLRSKQEKELLELRRWLEEREKDELLDKALDAIRDMGNATRSANQSVLSKKEALKAIQARQEKLEKARSDLLERKATADATSKKNSIATKLCHEALTALLAGKKKEIWKEERVALEERRSKVRELWKIQSQYAKENEFLKVKIVEQKAEQANCEVFKKRLVELQTSLKSERERLKDKEIILRQANAIASLEERRAALQPGEPCDLCGSKEHPYASGELPSKSTSEKDFEDQRKKVDTLENEEKEVQKRNIRTQEKYELLSRNIGEIGDRIESLKTEFEEIAHESKVLIPIADSAGLVALGTELKTHCEHLDKTLSSVDGAEQALAKAEKEEIAGQTLITSLSDQIKQQDRLIKETVIEKDDAKKASVLAEKALSEALGGFNESVAKWSVGRVDLDRVVEVIKCLENRANEFQGRRKLEGDCLQRIERQKQTLETLQERRSQLAKESKDWQEKLGAIESAAVEVAALDRGDLNTVESRRRTYEDALTERTRCQSNVDAKKKDLVSLKNELANVVDLLNGKISATGFKSIEELDLILKSEKQVAELRQEKRVLDEEKVALDTLEKINRHAQAELREKRLPGEDDVGGLREALVLGGKELKAYAERLGELRNTLAADAKARTDSKSEVERIEILENQAKPWLVLRDLIGSADGSKFSRFAQGLTLEQLVVHANRHLVDLNPRYRIQRVVEADLELEIIDCYEADAVRPTRSLSGGESFLMSLALALGLSELAGQNTKIQSLFIDEGFGSLDGDTLDVALSALESLRLQNRSIGVISHVEDLKVRLGTQIQVRRKTDGHAELLVVDG